MKNKAVYVMLAVAVLAAIVGILYFRTGANQQASVGALNHSPTKWETGNSL
jgi:hypothetical protein